MFWKATITTALLIYAASSTCLPTVDLGTSLHRAIEGAIHDLYAFNNIPFAEPPLGDLRFANPVPVSSINRTTNDGSHARVCPQAPAPWFDFSFPLVLDAVAKLSNGSIPGGPPPAGPEVEESEDCLLLNVVVPKKVFKSEKQGAPVLVWIHGGGYIEGSKDEVDPKVLVARSVDGGREGLVYVATNYRLGLFGFPPRSPEDPDVSSNAGLFDQLQALEWIKSNIHHFGGDPSRITVIGESAGAGSIVAHLASSGANTTLPPFQRAVLQSPAIKPATDAESYALLHKQFLGLANISVVDGARGLSSEQLQGVNRDMVATSAFGSTHFGPNVDGKFLPADPARLLSDREVPSDIPVIVAHNLNEGLLFTDPRVQDQSAFKAYMSGLMPTIPEDQINRLAEEIYPEDFSGAQPYLNQTQRLSLAIAEGLINCYASGVSSAYAETSRAYRFNLPPGIHAEDLSYTFFNGERVDTLGLPLQVGVAEKMQDWVLDFAVLGDAGSGSVGEMPVYGPGAEVLNVGDGGFTIVADPSANSRCQFWLAELRYVGSESS